MQARGDTIIEVIFAVTIFSLVAISGISLMNQGSAIAQRSLEISQVRDQMDAQADALRYVHNAYVTSGDQDRAKAWESIVSNASKEVQPFDQISNGEACRMPQGGSDDQGTPFFMDTISKNKLDSDNPAVKIIANSSAETFAQVQAIDGKATAQGLWIQAARVGKNTDGGAATPGYYDFHIRACWLSPGQAPPVTLGTIVRLYDPS